MAKNRDDEESEVRPPLAYDGEPVEEGSGEEGRAGDMPGDEEGSSPHGREELKKLAEDDARRSAEAKRSLPEFSLRPVDDEEEG